MAAPAGEAVGSPDGGDTALDTALDGVQQVITKVGPERTCVGCGEKAHPAELVRIVLGPVSSPSKEGSKEASHEIAIDSGTGTFGRGAHVHGRPGCVVAAAQRGLARSFKSALTLDGERLTAPLLAAAIARTAERRLEGLLSSARRARRIALGADSVVAASRAGEAHLVLVATDAASAAELTEVRRAVADGRAVAWGTKDHLAAVAGGGERAMGLGVVAITDDRIARAAREAVQMADSMSALAAGSLAASPAQGTGPTTGSGRASGSRARSPHGNRAESTTSLTGDAARVGERRGEATDVEGGTPPPARGPSPSDDGSQAVE